MPYGFRCMDLEAILWITQTKCSRLQWWVGWSSYGGPACCPMYEERYGSKPAVDHRPFISNVDMAEDETYLDLFGLNGDGFKLTDWLRVSGIRTRSDAYQYRPSGLIRFGIQRKKLQDPAFLMESGVFCYVLADFVLATRRRMKKSQVVIKIPGLL